MTILLIDDDRFALKLLTRQLANLGHSDVMCFQQAQDAVAFLATSDDPQTLILCDLQMPGMDGVEMVRHLTTIHFQGGLALISGEDERILQTAATLANAHHLNMLGALHKPVATEQLRLVIERHHAHHAAIAMTARAPRKTYTAADLRDAIANDQLICHFQPKVALRTGKVVGVESLARWQHPTDGLVFPDRFITLAEESGQIDALTQAILRTALRQARVWMTEGIALAVAVNVSMENLVSLDFPEQVEQALLTARIKPDMLILEVTESRLMGDRLASLDILARLRLRHIGLSIDDFGTGHASFEQLRDVPFTELKIDRGFVNGAARDPARRTIFEASLRLAKELGLKTVAEGAEDRDDWNFLRQSGCDLVQGYFVGRPMPGADLSNWITQWEERYRDLAAKA